MEKKRVHDVDGVYSPNRLLDRIAADLQLEGDTALAGALNVTESIVKKIRSCNLPVPGSLLLRMHEVSAIEIKELRRLMGDRRGRLRVGHSLASRVTRSVTRSE